MGAEIKIVWGKRPIKQFKNAVLFIAQDSQANAEKFRVAILKKIDWYRSHPQACTLEKFKLYNDGSFFYFTKFHYRITYRFQKNTIKILRFRHEKQKPVFF